MATVDVYILNATEKAEFDALSPNGSVPSKFWKKSATIGGEANGAAPFWLLWWSPWKMMSSIWWDISMTYLPRGSGGQVDAGSGHYTATTPTRRTFKKSSGYYYLMQVTTITNQVYAAGSVARNIGAAYASRTADAYTVKLTPWEYWTDNKWYKYGPFTLNALYAPTTFTDVTLSNLDATDIELSFTVDDWERETDTWEVLSITTGGETYRPISTLKASPTISDDPTPITSLSLPRSKFATPPKLTDGDTCSVDVKLVSPRITQAYTLNGDVEVVDISAPRCAIERDEDGGVTVYVEAYDSAGDATVASVSLVGAMYGGDSITEDLTGDTVSVEIGGVSVDCVPFVFHTAPRDAVEYVVIAADPSVGEATIELSLPAYSGDVNGLWFIPLDGEPYAALYNIKLTLATDWTGDTVQLAGREHPSAFYGAAGTDEWSVSWDVVNEHGAAEPDVDEVRGLCRGACVVELPTGRRFLANVADIGFNRNNSNTIISISCKVAEVSG